MFHFHPTKSQRVQFQTEERETLFPLLPSSAAAGAGGLISPGKGQKDGGKEGQRERERERGKGNERRKVGRIIHVDDEEDEDVDEGEGEDGSGEQWDHRRVAAALPVTALYSVDLAPEVYVTLSAFSSDDQ